MKNFKMEFILIIILVPILAYVGWQVYNTYIKEPDINIKGLNVLEQQPEKEINSPMLDKNSVSLPIRKPVSRGTLNYTGYIKRDPLMYSLPVKIKEKKYPAAKPSNPVSNPVEKRESQKNVKEIVLPKFTVTGIVWGKIRSRAIIGHSVYRVGDIIKGAKILDITKQGIHMIYQGKEFWVTVQGG